MADYYRTEPDPLSTAWMIDGSTEKMGVAAQPSSRWKSVAARCLLGLAMAAGVGTAVRAAEPIRIGSILCAQHGRTLVGASPTAS